MSNIKAAVIFLALMCILVARIAIVPNGDAEVANSATTRVGVAALDSSAHGI